MHVKDWAIGLAFGFLLRVIPAALTPLAERFEDVSTSAWLVVTLFWVVILVAVFGALLRGGLHMATAGTAGRTVLRLATGAVAGFLLGYLVVVSALVGVSDAALVIRLLAALLLAALLLGLLPILFRRGLLR